MLRHKIFVLSLHRSGTQSTHDWFLRAGLRSMHWPSRVGEVDYEGQARGRETRRTALLQRLAPVIDGYEALSDVPFPVLYKELYAAYPQARYVALYRSPYDWLASVRRHVGERELDPFEKVQYWHYLKDRPRHLHGLPDERLLEMHIRHHGNLLNFFAKTPNFRLFHLTDSHVGEKLAAFLGLPPLAMRRVDAARESNTTIKKAIKA